MDKLAQDRMMGALKTGKKPKKLALDPEDMKEMAKLGKSRASSRRKRATSRRPRGYK
jgi:hypothetical protein